MGESFIISAILIVLLVVVIFAVWQYGVPGREHIVSYAQSFQLPSRATQGRDLVHEGMTISPDQIALGEAQQSQSVYKALSRLNSTADVDPMITGQLYAYADGVRNVYAQRSSHGDGLAEYSSSGGPGDFGVDIGPVGLAEYGGKEIGFDDGIPAQWQMPSTPVRWYAPKQRDFYGPEGPTVYSQGVYTLTEPDHDPKM